jgi:hypothetical protein
MGQKLTVAATAVSLTTVTVPSGPAIVPGTLVPHAVSADATATPAATDLDVEGARNFMFET